MNQMYKFYVYLRLVGRRDYQVFDSRAIQFFININITAAMYSLHYCRIHNHRFIFIFILILFTIML